MKTLSIFSLAIILGIFSCKTTCGTRDNCIVQLHNFDSLDGRVVIIKNYTPDRQFSTLLNTKVLTDTMQPPTLVWDPDGNFFQVFPVSCDVDLLIDFPEIGKTYKITGRKVNNDKMSTQQCSSSYSYYRNDTQETFPTEPWINKDFEIEIYK